MDHSESLSDLRERIDRIEAELSVAKTALTGLEAKPEAVSEVAKGVSDPAPVGQVREPPLLTAPPPLLATEPISRQRMADQRPVRDWLMRLQLWPPRGGADAEVRLGAWWATRLGALFAVIGGVFFAAYISQGTAPAVKLGELVVLSLALWGLGSWLQRKTPGFGLVLGGAGLALLYFAAVAAHALPATRVITSAWVAFGVQAIAIGFIAVVSLWERSEATMVLAVLLGCATAWISGAEGLAFVPLWSLPLLAAVTVALGFKPGWRAPSVAALPATYLVCGVWQWSQVGTALSWWHWLPLCILFFLFLARDLLPHLRLRGSLPREAVLLQSTNSTVAAVVGWMMASRSAPNGVEAFFFVGAGLLLATGLAWRWRKKESPLALILFGQAGALLALGLARHYDGDLRSLTLLALACVLLVTARVGGLRPLRYLALIVWLASYGQFGALMEGYAAVPVSRLLPWLLCSGLLWSYDQRWFVSMRGLSYVGGALLGLATWRAGVELPARGWMPVWCVGAGLGFLALALLARAWRAVAVAVGLLLFVAHIAMMFYRAEIYPSWQLWLNGAAFVVAVVLIGGVWDWRDKQEGKAGIRLRAVLAIGAALVLQHIFAAGLTPSQSFSCTALAAVLLLLASRWARRWPLAVAGVVALAWNLLSQDHFYFGDATRLLFVAAALAWSMPVLLRHSPRLRDAIRPAKWRGALPWIQVALASWISLEAIFFNFNGGACYLGLAAEAFAVFCLAWKAGVRPAWLASSFLVLAGSFKVAFDLAQNRILEADVLTAVGVAALALVASVTALLARGFIPERRRALSLWLHGGLGLGLLYWFVAAQQTGIADYATVVWGVGGIAAFAAGLWLREKIYRLLGLAGLLACVPRAFLVDIDATFHRIIAFVVLGVVLLWVGFSYHKFRHLIPTEREDGGKGDEG